MQKINANSNEDIVFKLVVPLEQRGKNKLFQNFPLKFDIPWCFFFVLAHIIPVTEGIFYIYGLDCRQHKL